MKNTINRIVFLSLLLTSLSAGAVIEEDEKLNGNDHGGGGLAHSFFVRNVNSILDIFKNVSWGRDFARENKLDVSLIKSKTSPEKIVTVPDLGKDSLGNVIDARVYGSKIEIHYGVWTEYAMKESNVRALVCKEMMRASSYNKGNQAIEICDKLETLIHRNSTAKSDTESPLVCEVYQQKGWVIKNTEDNMYIGQHVFTQIAECMQAMNAMNSSTVCAKSVNGGYAMFNIWNNTKIGYQHIDWNDLNNCVSSLNSMTAAVVCIKSGSGQFELRDRTNTSFRKLGRVDSFWTDLGACQWASFSASKRDQFVCATNDNLRVSVYDRKTNSRADNANYNSAKDCYNALR